jgi:hypothetical protein
MLLAFRDTLIYQNIKINIIGYRYFTSEAEFSYKQNKNLLFWVLIQATYRESYTLHYVLVHDRNENIYYMIFYIVTLKNGMEWKEHVLPPTCLLASPLHTSESSSEQWSRTWTCLFCTYELFQAPRDHLGLDPSIANKWITTPENTKHKTLPTLLRNSTDR